VTALRFGRFSPALQISYSRFRDWFSMPCPELEEWLESEIIPLDKALSKGLDRIARPKTILDKKPVKAWFRAAQHVDPALCRDLTSLIRRRSFGYRDPSPSVLRNTEVRSPPIPLYILVDMVSLTRRPWSIGRVPEHVPRPKDIMRVARSVGRRQRSPKGFNVGRWCRFPAHCGVLRV
jgi:hypothetical protein